MFVVFVSPQIFPLSLFSVHQPEGYDKHSVKLDHTKSYVYLLCYLGVVLDWIGPLSSAMDVLLPVSFEHDT